MPNDWLWPKPSLLAQKNSPLAGGNREGIEAGQCRCRSSAGRGRQTPCRDSNRRVADSTNGRRSRMDGVMFERLANVDSFIYSDSNGEIASIYDPAKLQICVEVNQRDVARSRVGQRAEVTRVLEKSCTRTVGLSTKRPSARSRFARRIDATNSSLRRANFASIGSRFSVFGSRLANRTNQLSFASRLGERLLTSRPSASARNCRGG